MPPPIPSDNQLQIEVSTLSNVTISVSIFTKMNLTLYHNLLFTTSKPLLKSPLLQVQGINHAT